MCSFGCSAGKTPGPIAWGKKSLFFIINFALGHVKMDVWWSRASEISLSSPTD